MFYTYAHTKPDGTIFYIGKGKGRRAWDVSHRNQFWKNTVTKYGGFNHEILANWDTEEEAFSHEVLLISCFKDMGYKLVNLSDGGEGSSGYKYTEDQRKNRSGEKNGMFGRIRADKELKNISEGTKLAMAAPKIKAKLSLINSKENNPNWGKVASNAKKIVINDIEFSSHSKAAKHLGISRTKFGRLFKAGVL